MRYQKLHLFLEPYHAPYTANYRYWTGLLLFVRFLLGTILVLNFSLDQCVYLFSVIIIVGGLILLKGVTAKRVYKNWPLDVMETAIYYNLIAFSVLTWYNLDSRGDRAAIAFTFIMIIFILLFGIIIFHMSSYTKIYKRSFLNKTFNWISSMLTEKRPKKEAQSDGPEELDRYQLDRFAAGSNNYQTLHIQSLKCKMTHK